MCLDDCVLVTTHLGALRACPYTELRDCKLEKLRNVVVFDSERHTLELRAMVEGGPPEEVIREVIDSVVGVRRQEEMKYARRKRRE